MGIRPPLRSPRPAAADGIAGRSGVGRGQVESRRTTLRTAPPQPESRTRPSEDPTVSTDWPCGLKILIVGHTVSCNDSSANTISVRIIPAYFGGPITAIELWSDGFSGQVTPINLTGRDWFKR